ncbi:ankyrin repeat-containing protein [Striga asiatica]|uniref:Ankyrin repeat-containing protein n=1 Tax=Striga asiatica TaxID=4170 RepID=A0A5A7P8W2_STRAF|nr:ankyrin repeat-containing protein [Striga asiatica]
MLPRSICSVDFSKTLKQIVCYWSKGMRCYIIITSLNECLLVRLCNFHARILSLITWDSSRTKMATLANSNPFHYIINVEDSTESWALPLYRALNHGDYETVEMIIRQEPTAITSRLTPFAETPLLVAVKARQGLPFLRKLLGFMPPEALALTDYFGNTALHAVAVLGDTRAAALFVEKNRDLPNVWNVDGCLPIHLAAMRGHREITLYLCSVAKEDDYSDLFKGSAGAQLVHSAVTAGLYDFALYLLEHNPELALQYEDISPLELLAQEPSAFPSGMDFNIWQLLVYSCVPKKLIEMPESLAIMTKSLDYRPFTLHRQCRNRFSRGNSTGTICDTMEVVPIKRIRHTKAMHHQALKIVRRACSEIKCLDNSKASSILTSPFLIGVQNGIHEIVKEILDSFPHAITFADEENHSIFHLAVMYRHEKIFKIVHAQSGQYKMCLSLLLDNARNNILHLVAHKPHQDRLDTSTGSFLKMQRELQWYKEVEKFVLPHARKSKNADGKTPLAIFNEQHRELAANETQWMMSMATSCTVAASLIATVAFAAAITVPGGNDAGGLPTFADENAFVLFAVSDALALLSSVTTVLSFLSIFTSRYTVNDFLYELPNRLIVGLISLFLSVLSLMVAFGSTMYLVAARKNGLLLLPIVALACVPVTLFAFLQLPPLLNMISSTYGPSIFD